MHYTDITNLIIGKGYRTSLGATPAATVSANLSSDIKHNKKSKFVKIQKSTYGLKKYSTQYLEEDDETEIKQNIKQKKYSNIINSFGIFWDRDSVFWKSSTDLNGYQSSGGATVNFKNQKGIYLLYDGREIIYIGQAIKQTIAERLFQHTKDRLKNRWNRFSWFGLYSVSNNGKLNIWEESTRTISIKSLANSLEAVLIESIEPRQNRKAGNNFDSLEYNQKEDERIEEEKEKKIKKDIINKLNLK